MKEDVKAFIKGLTPTHTYTRTYKVFDYEIASFKQEYTAGGGEMDNRQT